jgi:hypothetical protein
MLISFELFFDPEDGGDMFLRKVKDYTASHSRRQNSSQNLCYSLDVNAQIHTHSCGFTNKQSWTADKRIPLLETF